MTLYVVFALCTLGLALLVLLAIWRVADMENLGKPIGTLAVIALASGMLLSATRIIGGRPHEADREP